MMTMKIRDRPMSSSRGIDMSQGSDQVERQRANSGGSAITLPSRQGDRNTPRSKSSSAEGKEANAPQGLDDSRGGVVLKPRPKKSSRREKPGAWISPYLRRTGQRVPPRTTLKLNARTRMQQKTLLLLEERELLDPGANNLLFVGANRNTNVMAVMLLKETGYNVKTVIDLDELETLSRLEGSDQLASSIDCVIVDFNVIKFSVDYVIRALGGGHLLGMQIVTRDIPVIAMSARSPQLTVLQEARRFLCPEAA